MTYKQFETKWLGKRVDTDYFPKGHVYQCVDLVKQYMKECQGVPYGAYGDANHYWVRTSPVILKKFVKVKATGALAGDIVILKGTPGHIGVGTNRRNALYVEILEQNGSTGNGSGLGRDAIRKRYIPRWRIAGLLRPKTSL